MSVKAAYCRPWTPEEYAASRAKDHANVWEDFRRVLALFGLVVVLTSVVAALHAFGHDAIIVWTVLVLLGLFGLFLLVCTWMSWRDVREFQEAIQRCSAPLPPAADVPPAP